MRLYEHMWGGLHTYEATRLVFVLQRIHMVLPELVGLCQGHGYPYLSWLVAQRDRLCHLAFFVPGECAVLTFSFRQCFSVLALEFNKEFSVASNDPHLALALLVEVTDVARPALVVAGILAIGLPTTAFH